MEPIICMHFFLNKCLPLGQAQYMPKILLFLNNRAIVLRTNSEPSYAYSCYAYKRKTHTAGGRSENEHIDWRKDVTFLWAFFKTIFSLRVEVFRISQDGLKSESSSFFKHILIHHLLLKEHRMKERSEKSTTLWRSYIFLRESLSLHPSFPSLQDRFKFI